HHSRPDRRRPGRRHPFGGDDHRPRPRGRRLRLPDGARDGVLPDLARPRPAPAAHRPRKDGVLIMSTATPATSADTAAPAASAAAAPPVTRSTPTRRRRRGKVGRERVNWPATVLLMLGSLTVLVPLFVTLNMSLKTTAQAVDGNAFSLPA